MPLVITTTPPFESDMFMRGEAQKKDRQNDGIHQAQRKEEYRHLLL